MVPKTGKNTCNVQEWTVRFNWCPNRSGRAGRRDRQRDGLDTGHRRTGSAAMDSGLAVPHQARIQVDPVVPLADLDRQLEATYAYLRQVAPVRNRVAPFAPDHPPQDPAGSNRR